ncbi:hypothetical protein F5148DRAFT_87079 [Russula earlei]|uniref:Uncharacterized protein n=1 Tax=Russula earlei TaxID=71964 RepID=A0ACC0U8A9_9AGAM|nr:hypothetical protein F5148DRAFT_87079 [Russula earlei]
MSAILRFPLPRGCQGHHLLPPRDPPTAQIAKTLPTVHLPKAVQTQTPSPSTTASSTRLHGEVVLLRGRGNIQDTTPRRITLRSTPPSSKTTSEATVVVRMQARSRPNRSGYSGQQRLFISTVPPNPPVRPRSHTSSVTKATITHYRQSLLDTKRKHRPPRKEDSARSSSVDRVPKFVANALDATRGGSWLSVVRGALHGYSSREHMKVNHMRDSMHNKMTEQIPSDDNLVWFTLRRSNI